MATPVPGVTRNKVFTPSMAEAALLRCFKAGDVPLLKGDPGIGKSQITMRVADLMFAEKYGYSIDENGRVRDPKGKFIGMSPLLRPWFREFRTAQRDPVDLMGVPHVEKKSSGQGASKREWFETGFATPGFLQSMNAELGGIIFLDEINRGPEMTQNACFTILDHGVVGDFQIPDTWLPCAAINEKDIGARKMGAALRSRFTHMTMVTNLNDVMRVAAQRDWEPGVMAYLRFCPDALHEYDPKADVPGPNPRAWERVSDLLSAGPPDASFELLVEGRVGEGHAIKFCGFLRYFNELPSIESIWMDPKKAQLVNKPETMYAVAAALARRVTENNFEKAIQYMDRLPVEFNFMMVNDAIHRNPVLQTTAAYNKWCVAHDNLHS